LSNRVAIVTGAGQGIGRGIAVRYAHEGGAIVIGEINPESGQRVAEELTEISDAGAVFVPTDVRQPADIRQLVDVTLDTFGRVDILVNSAMTVNPFDRFERKTVDDLERSFAVGPSATLCAMNTVFPHMRAQRWGRIINLVSLNGVVAAMYWADYNAAKEAIRALTRTAAREWARHNVLVNALAPGAASPAWHAFAQREPDSAAAMLKQNPMGRMGDPEHDIGGVAVFLASSDSDYVTGNTIFADGGVHINGSQWDPELPE
jgi:NAD(P)-dependent dehydrogenase (short-subunit alcohol dehydrogenase family)